MLDHSARGVLRLHVAGAAAHHCLLAVRTVGTDEPATKGRLQKLLVVQAATSSAATPALKLVKLWPSHV